MSLRVFFIGTIISNMLSKANYEILPVLSKEERHQQILI